MIFTRLFHFCKNRASEGGRLFLGLAREPSEVFAGVRRLRFEGTLCVTLFDLRPAMPPFRGARLYFATPPRVQIDLAVEKVPFNLSKVSRSAKLWGSRR